MSLFNSSFQGRSFRSNLLQAPDKASKIREQGLRELEGKEKVLSYINSQAEKVANRLDAANAKYLESAGERYNEKVQQARLIAEAKWSNFETGIKNLKAKEKKNAADRTALMKLVPAGVKALEDIDIKRKLNIDDYASQIYRDYGLGWKQAEALINADQKLLADDTKLQAFLREIEVDGNTPMDVIERIRKGGGYLPIAIQKVSAQRFGQSLIQRIGQRANDNINLPGYDGPLSLNTAKGPLFSTVLNQLISEELKDSKTGQQRFSNKIMQMAGLNGVDGTISKTIGAFERRHAEATIKESWASRHQETISKIEAFIGPGDKGGGPVGGAGLQSLIIHFAGGENASGRALSDARSRVIDGAIEGLDNGRLTWPEVEELGELEIFPRGMNGKGVKWKDHFEKEWFALKEAGRRSEAKLDAQLVLADAQQRRLGREAYEGVLELIADGNPTVETLIQLDEDFTEKGKSFEEARLKVQRALRYKQNTAAKRAAERTLIQWRKNNVFITDEMIENLQLDETSENNARALIRKHNKSLPTQGKGGTEERLKGWISDELYKIIPQSSSWDKNSSHDDTVAYALRDAAQYYRTKYEQTESHEASYEYARDMITKEIQLANDDKGNYRTVDAGDGTNYFYIGRANLNTKVIELTTDKIAQDIQNPNIIYDKLFMDSGALARISERANRGDRVELPVMAMKISAMSKGRISPVNFMKAQVELARNNEITKKGSSNIQPLPESWVKSFEKEVERIPPVLRHYLNDENYVGTNKAYTKSGYQPPIQEPYYKKLRPLVTIEDADGVAGDDLEVKNSKKSLGYTISKATIRQVLQLMENGHFSSAGIGQWDAARLEKAAGDAGMLLDSQFNELNQKKLIDSTIKYQGREGFPHVELQAYDEALFGDVHKNLGEEKISSTFWRERAACSRRACEILQEMGHPLHQLDEVGTYA